MRNFFDSSNERTILINDRISLIESRDGQRFSGDAFLLSAFAAKDPSSAAVDLGSGTGVCSLFLADYQKASHVYSIEIQPQLHALAVRNAEKNRLSEKMTPICTDLRLLMKSSFEHPIGTVIANPPYFPNGTGRISPNDSKNAARFELNGGIYDFCAAASRIMTPNGHFFCVIRPERLPDLFSALRSSALEPKTLTMVYHNPTSVPSAALVEAVRSQVTQLRVTRPLFSYLDEKTKTPDAKRIYETCSFEDFLNER